MCAFPTKKIVYCNILDPFSGQSILTLIFVCLFVVVVFNAVMHLGNTRERGEKLFLEFAASSKLHAWVGLLGHNDLWRKSSSILVNFKINQMKRNIVL